MKLTKRNVDGLEVTGKWYNVTDDEYIAHLPDSKTGAKPLHLPTPALTLWI